ncbi:MAG: ion transporter [Gammaproteobacteria bacterium]|nr:ion transporter [Gammaproteobacteria bacterium]
MENGMKYMMKKIKNVVESSRFQHFIMGLIVLNGITMGFEVSSYYHSNYNLYFEFFNSFVVTIFTIEIIMRISVYGKEFFKDPWSLFDFTIVWISLVPTGGGFEIFRVLRVLRLFRLITVVPQMKKIVVALLKVIPGIASIGALLTLFFYIFAIMSTQLFGEKFPQWFGTLGESFYTLFQIMTLESWSMGIVRPVMDVYPLAWMFFVPFIFLATFIIINLIIAIVVDAMNEMKDENNKTNNIYCYEQGSYIENDVKNLLISKDQKIHGLLNDVNNLKNQIIALKTKENYLVESQEKIDKKFNQILDTIKFK